MKAKPIMSKLKPYQPGRTMEQVKQKYGLEKVVKLASNENPFGCSPQVKNSLVREYDNLTLYPDGYATELRNKVASHLGVAPEMLIFGNGSDEIVQILSRAILEKGTNTVMASPTFSQYKHNALIEGAEIKEVPAIDGSHDLEGMLHAINDQTRIVWLCSPNNPTGKYIAKNQMEDFLMRCPKNVIVVVDEAYYEYVTANDYPELVPELSKHPNLVLLRTFSKAYGLASLRVGYGIASQEIIQLIEPAREPFNTSRFAQQAATAAMDDQEFIKKTVIKNKEGRSKLIQFCEELNLSYYPSEANFLTIHLPCSGDEMFEYLMKNGYIVRSGEALGVPNSIRVTIGTEEDLDSISKLIEKKVNEIRKMEKNS
ncbi:histidinol-phosphate transaminase [Bacillaceae bacterium S4-13-56]